MSGFVGVYDDDGCLLTVGARVRLVNDASARGVVVSISDPDYDYDDGRVHAWPPVVRVRFDEGDEDTFGSWQRPGGDVYECCDVLAR